MPNLGNYFMFTMNNPFIREEKKDIIVLPRWDDETMNYLVYQLEQGVLSDGRRGTTHWQGFVWFKDGLIRSIKAVQKHLGLIDCHIDKAASPYDAMMYCKKPELLVKKDKNDKLTFVIQKWAEHGTPLDVAMNQGYRSDLSRALRGAMEHGMNKGVKDDDTLVRYASHIQKARAIRMPKKTWKTELFFFWGPTGTGKTYTAINKLNELFGEDGWGCKSDSTGAWWDGYDGEKGCLVNDFGAGQISISQLLNLCDAAPAIVPIKGSFVPWQARTLIITCHEHPAKYWPADRWPEIFRRCGKKGANIINFATPYVDPNETDEPDTDEDIERWTECQMALDPMYLLKQLYS